MRKKAACVGLANLMQPSERAAIIRVDVEAMLDSIRFHADEGWSLRLHSQGNFKFSRSARELVEVFTFIRPSQTR